MPPIFGIFHTRLQQPDQEVVARIKNAACYLIPHEVQMKVFRGGFVAYAKRSGIPVQSINIQWFEQEDFIIIADACLYKRKEFINRLGNSNHLGNKSDAALILKAYMKWGEKCLQFLYGDFSFVIFNKQSGEYFCGRDPLGVRPLFYCTHNQLFIFASELRLVVNALPYKPSIRRDYLLDTLVSVKIDKDMTPYENIYRLKPGHFQRFSGEKTITAQYWSLNPEKKIRLEVEKDYIQLFREILVEAVKARCTNVNGLGAELSGGLDSSAICGIAAVVSEQLNMPITAFSNVFPIDSEVEFTDEREFIDAMLQFRNIDWVSVDRLNRSIPDLLKFSLNIQGCFIQQNYSVLNQCIYEAAGKRGIEILLSGFGGDELVSAHTVTPWAELLKDRQWRVIVDELFYKGITFKSLLKPGLLLTRYLHRIINKPKYNTSFFAPELLDKRFANLPIQHEFAVKNQLRQRLENKYKLPWYPQLVQNQYRRIMHEHIPQRMEYCYTAASQYGIEYRYPLLDIDLLETFLAFPSWIKKHHGINRYLFRQSVVGFMPENLRQRNDKSGITIPQTYYSLVKEREAIFELIKTCADSDYLNGIFDFSRFPQWYEKLVKRDKSDMNYLRPGAFYDFLMILLYFKEHE
jgi:asparagine synthase (glutamine-hydrolysing)